MSWGSGFRRLENLTENSGEGIFSSEPRTPPHIQFMDRTLFLLVFHLADYHDYFALDFYGAGVFDEDRAHRRVGGLQPNATIFVVEIFQGGFRFIIQPDCYHITIFNLVLRWLHDDDIAIIDHRVDHGISANLQRKELLYTSAG